MPFNEKHSFNQYILIYFQLIFHLLSHHYLYSRIRIALWDPYPCYIYSIIQVHTHVTGIPWGGGTNLLSHTFCPPYKENTHFNPSQGFLSGPERREILLEICAMSSSNAFFCPLHEKSCFFKSPLLMLWHMSFLFNICPLSLSIVMSKSCSFHQCCESGTCKFWSEISVENLSALITNNTVHTGTSLYDVQFK